MIADTIEQIWHFAGHLRLTGDYVASRIELGDIPYIRGESVFELSPDQRLARAAAPEEVNGSAGIRHVSLSDWSQEINWTQLPGYGWTTETALPTPREPVLATMTSNSAAPLSIASGLGDASPHLQAPDRDVQPQEFAPEAVPAYEIKYVPGASDTVASLSQTNIVSDRDVYSDLPAELGPMPHVASDGAMAEMLSLAAEFDPTTAASGAEIEAFWIAAVEERHDAIASGEVVPEKLESGQYVDGVLGPSEADIPTDNDEPAAATAESEEPRESSETGGNVLKNAAVIADLNEAPSTLIVGGRYFETNAVVQTNILQNEDTLLHTGGALPLLDSADDNLDNVATFVAHEIAAQHTSKGSGGLIVNVDYVEGDVIDVKMLTQRNVLEDGDVTVQTRAENYREHHTGDNEQGNVAKFTDWGKHYDVVIVLGDYHSANIISQTNLVLDNDIFGASGSSSLESGRNALENEATIGKYGAPSFESIDSDLSRLMTDLSARNDLDQDTWSSYNGAASGRLDILFVTGNYYDINVISQINILADADLVLQAGNDGLSWLSTGGNSALNQASIINAGGLHEQYLGGELYEDSILVQADLVSDSQTRIETDPTALVSELVAFMDQPTDTSEDATSWHRDVSGHSDGFGHVLT